MTYHPAITATGYKLLARAIGIAMAYNIASDIIGGVAQETMINCLIAELKADNPSFDEKRFRRAIEAVRLAEMEAD
jgi:hypothetical protein